MVPESRLTLTSDTPASLRTALSTWAEHAEQVMPVTINFCFMKMPPVLAWTVELCALVPRQARRTGKVAVYLGSGQRQRNERVGSVPLTYAGKRNARFADTPANGWEAGGAGAWDRIAFGRVTPRPSTGDSLVSY